MTYKFLDQNSSYDKNYPDHARTSCSDENPINADPDGSGCWRCNAIAFDEGDRANLQIAIEKRKISELNDSFKARQFRKVREEYSRQLAEALSLASQINTDWIPANKKLAEKIAEREAVIERLREALKFYTFCYGNCDCTPEGGIHDTAYEALAITTDHTALDKAIKQAKQEQRDEDNRIVKECFKLSIEQMADEVRSKT